MKINEIRNDESANDRVLKNVKVIRDALQEIQTRVAEYEALAVKGEANWGHVGDLSYIRQHTRYAAGEEHDEDPR